VMGALGFARFGYATILPSMKDALLLNNTQMGMIATGNLIGYTAFSLIGGLLAARFGPRLLIGCSMLVTGATMFMTGAVGGFWPAVVIRFLTGLGSAGANVPVMGLVSAWFGPRRRGMAAGFLVGGSGFGFLITGFLVPRVIAASPDDGWRFGWFILGGTVILLAGLSSLLLRNKPSEMGCRPIGGSQAAAPGGDRLSWGSLYTSPALWRLGLVYLFFGFSYIIYGTFFAAAMTADKGFTQAQAGAVWSGIGALAVFSGIAWGTVSDYLGRKNALALVFGLQAVSYFLFGMGDSPAALYASALLYGLTAFSIPGIVAAACGDYVGPRLAPAALGMVTFFFAVGQALAPSIAGYLADVTSSFNAAFFLAAVVAAMGSGGSLTLRAPR
ncbi:MAG: YbfB/YjiJ family MFS transporter, partial [Thermoanaerobacterales bacterium]|nr:YbfB/YjiJ family MFS transporter [Thermoanaerobacterales bacterium]